jgi:hypothetical protein
MDYAIRGIKDGMATKMDFSTPMEKSKLELAWKNYNLAKDEADAKNKLLNARAAALSSGTGTGSGTGKGRVVAYEKPINFNNNGEVEIVNSGDNYSTYKPKGRRVKINREGDNYSITVNGKTLGVLHRNDAESSKYEVNYIDENGAKLNEEELKSLFKDYLGGSYNAKYDDTNVKRLLEHLDNIITKEGEDAYNNYDFYYDPDKSSNDNQRGGGSIYPLGRVQPTPYSGNSYIDEDTEDDNNL